MDLEETEDACLFAIATESNQLTPAYGIEFFFRQDWFLRYATTR